MVILVNMKHKNLYGANVVLALVCHKSCYELLNKKLKYKLEIKIVKKLDHFTIKKLW